MRRAIGRSRIDRVIGKDSTIIRPGGRLDIGYCYVAVLRVRIGIDIDTDMAAGLCVAVSDKKLIGRISRLHQIQNIGDGAGGTATDIGDIVGHAFLRQITGDRLGEILLLGMVERQDVRIRELEADGRVRPGRRLSRAL